MAAHRFSFDRVRRLFFPTDAGRLDEKRANAARKEAVRKERRRRAAQVARDAEQSGDVAVVDYPRHEIRILVTSDAERKWRTTACAKEPWTVAWLDARVRPGEVLYDIGANVGVFSLIAGTLLEGHGAVVAFEPGYANYARLCENIVLNELEERIIPVPLPLSSRTGLQAFTYRSVEPGQSRHTFTGEAWTGGAPRPKHRRYSQPMLGMTLDAAVSLFALPRPTLIKLDVDGAELHVLEGAQETLAVEALRSLVVEIDGELTDPVMALLARFGFRLVERPDRGRDKKAWYGIFARE